MLNEEGAKAETKVWTKDGGGAEAEGGELQRQAGRRSLVATRITRSDRLYC